MKIFSLAFLLAKFLAVHIGARFLSFFFLPVNRCDLRYCILLYCSLNVKRHTWEAQLDEFITTEVLTSNCILSAAFTVYCAPLKSYSRSVDNSLCVKCSL